MLNISLNDLYDDKELWRAVESKVYDVVIRQKGKPDKTVLMIRRKDYGLSGQRAFHLLIKETSKANVYFGTLIVTLKRKDV